MAMRRARKPRGRTSSPTDPPGPLRQALRDRALLVVALGFGVVAALLAGVGSESAYLPYRSVPREVALVVQEVDGPHEIRCTHKEKVREETTTYRVVQPRAGFPAEFTVTGCPPDAGPGGYVEIARNDAGTRPDVSVDPWTRRPRSLR